MDELSKQYDNGEFRKTNWADTSQKLSCYAIEQVFKVFLEKQQGTLLLKTYNHGVNNSSLTGCERGRQEKSWTSNVFVWVNIIFWERERERAEFIIYIWLYRTYGILLDCIYIWVAKLYCEGRSKNGAIVLL